MWSSWRICCIWRSTSIYYVQTQPGMNSDLGNGSFWVEIPDAKHVDRCWWRSTRIWAHQLTSDLRHVYFFGSACNGGVWKQFRCVRLSLEACGAPPRQAALVRRPFPSRHNNPVHTGFSCGSVKPPSGEHFSSYRLHVCNFHTGILACVVDNVFINFFFHRSLRTFRFFSFFETIFSPFHFYFYHGDQTISRTSWRIYCIWQSISIQYVQIQPDVNSDLGNGSFWVEIRHAQRVDRCSCRSTRVWSHQLTSDLRDVYFFGNACNDRVWKQFCCLDLS